MNPKYKSNLLVPWVHGTRSTCSAWSTRSYSVPSTRCHCTNRFRFVPLWFCIVFFLFHGHVLCKQRLRYQRVINVTDPRPNGKRQTAATLLFAPSSADADFLTWQTADDFHRRTYRKNILLSGERGPSWRSWRASGAWAPSSETRTSCSASTFAGTPCAPIASKWLSWKVTFRLFGRHVFDPFVFRSNREFRLRSRLRRETRCRANVHETRDKKKKKLTKTTKI